MREKANEVEDLERRLLHNLRPDDSDYSEDPSCGEIVIAHDLYPSDIVKLASEQGLGAHVVTQFSFVPHRVLEFCADLDTRSPETPVYVGMAGPAKLRQLVHFARYCGVSASLSAVRKVGVKVAQLVDHRRADEQQASLAQFNASHGRSNIIGVHLFSFGGFQATAEWMNQHLNLATT